MIPSTIFALVAVLSSLAAVNGAVVPRDGTFTFLSPQPTAPGQGGGSTTTTASSQSSSVTSTRSTTPTGTSTTASTSIIPPVTSSTTSPSTMSTLSTTPSSTIKTATTTQSVTTIISCSQCPPTVTTPSVTVSPPLTTPTPSSGTVSCDGVQQWQAPFAYNAGNRVIFNGQLFTAKQWTYNNAPPTHADQWIANGVCSQPIHNQANCNGVAAWQNTVAYTAGNKVTFNGHVWSAVQWTQSNSPGDTSGSWQDLGACA